ncbi:hypothetical protein SASPL_100141 [Salvia splendens]|uniref:Uncharacterized protein n=1 Tax=Salvia splendens TaxID=180675 RepID=A0A8X8YS64_SALSN|nr:uncharacterized protein LOC121803869 [Salvia splendens]KAG6435271.1 hypothetical protein SASPL_100141 [Salvia splendens]
MWDWLDSWCCSLPITRQKQPNQSPLLTAADAASRPNCISFSAAAAMLISWLNRRRRRYLLLILCSPFLVPLLCATCPIMCAVELCFLISRLRRRKEVASGRGRSGDGGGGEGGLLQRYLEDQLMLVWGNDDLGEGGGVDVECFDRAGAVLQ